MQHPIDYSFALNQLARAQASILLTQADDLSDCLTEYIKRGLKDMPPDYLMAAHEEHQLLARHTHDESPSRPGMYLKLLHGRRSVREGMGDWGADGPWIGPLKWFHCTYLSSIGIGFDDGGEIASMSSGGDLPSPMFLSEGLLYFKGVYYGDWELQTLCGLEAERRLSADSI